jgi:hypothetical protein
MMTLHDGDNPIITIITVSQFFTVNSVLNFLLDKVNFFCTISVLLLINSVRTNYCFMGAILKYKG